MNQQIDPTTGEVLSPPSASGQIDQLAAALVKAQAALGNVVKDRKAEAGKYSYTYADLAGVLEACRKPLTDNGLSVIQRPDGNELETLLLHQSGQWLSGRTPLLVKQSAGPQDYGSALTYARRYGLLAMVGLATEDDDGAAAQRRTTDDRPQASAGAQQSTSAGPDTRADAVIQQIRELDAAFKTTPSREILAKLELIPDYVSNKLKLPQLEVARVVGVYNPVKLAMCEKLGIDPKAGASSAPASSAPSSATSAQPAPASKDNLVGEYLKRIEQLKQQFELGLESPQDVIRQLDEIPPAVQKLNLTSAELQQIIGAFNPVKIAVKDRVEGKAAA